MPLCLPLPTGDRVYAGWLLPFERIAETTWKCTGNLLDQYPPEECTIHPKI